jgi:hypothetical protein
VGDGDDDQDDEKPVASSTSDATERDAKHASVPLRRVRTGELRWEKFLYELKAGPAGGRLRWPSSAGSTTVTGSVYRSHRPHAP